MIKLMNIKKTKVMYIKKKDTVLIDQDWMDDDEDECKDVEITFRNYISINNLIIEDVDIEDVISRLDSAAWQILIKDFIWS